MNAIHSNKRDWTNIYTWVWEVFCVDDVGVFVVIQPRQQNGSSIRILEELVSYHRLEELVAVHFVHNKLPTFNCLAN